MTASVTRGWETVAEGRWVFVGENSQELQRVTKDIRERPRDWQKEDTKWYVTSKR